LLKLKAKGNGSLGAMMVRLKFLNTGLSNLMNCFSAFQHKLLEKHLMRPARALKAHHNDKSLFALAQ